MSKLKMDDGVNMGLQGAKILGDKRVSDLLDFKWPKITDDPNRAGNCAGLRGAKLMGDERVSSLLDFTWPHKD